MARQAGINKTIQPSFAKGELSPELHGRVDTALYRIGLATAKNAEVHTYGGISNRHGLEYLAPVKDHSYSPRLIPFEFKTQDQYILEFGDAYMRVIRNDAHVTETAKNITAITQADPGVLTSTTHGYSTGDEVFISSVSGMVQLNNRRYKVAVLSSNTFSLQDQVTGEDIDTTTFSAYSSGGTTAKIFELVTPFAVADLWNIKYTQSADVMTLVHKNYNIYELSRTGHAAWTITKLSVGPTVNDPTGISVSNAGTGTDWYYRVTAIDRETEEESLPGLNTTSQSITGATNASPVVLTVTSHPFSDGELIEINSVGGMTELNGNRYIVANEDTNSIELTDIDGNNIDGTSFGTYTSGGTANQTFFVIDGGSSLSTNNSTITWTEISGASRYAVYRRDNGIYGLIGETELATFTDDGITPDLDTSPPKARNPFDDASDQPGAVGYFEQRRVFGGSINKPDTSEYSQTGNYDNFNRSFPQQADDAITATLPSRQVNEIRHYVPKKELIVFTSGSDWQVTAGQDSGFGPDTIRQYVQSDWGSSERPPLSIGQDILFITPDEQNVRSFGYSLADDQYTGGFLNIASRHLLQGYTITDWCYSRIPDSRAYMVRSDGKAVTLSYDKEQEVVAWTWFETKGDFTSCASLRGGGDYNEDSIYWVVKRKVNSNTVRYIEVSRVRYFPDVRDCFFVDCGTEFNTPITITGVTSADPVVVTAPSHGLSNGDEVDIFDIVWDTTTDFYGNSPQPDQLNTHRYLVANKTSTTFELTDLQGNDIDGSAYTNYISGGTVRATFSSLDDLDHLEGESLVALCDGNVVSNLTVASGAVSLPRNFSRVYIGLPYTTDIETLNMDDGSGGLQGSDTQIPSIIVRFFKSRGLWIGPDSSSLVEMKQREFEKYGDPTDLLSGDAEINLTSDWNSKGRIFMRQRYPLPLTILAVIPRFSKGDD